MIAHREPRSLQLDGALTPGDHRALFGLSERDVGLLLETALSMVTSNPARAVGLHNEVGVIRKGVAANLLLIDPGTLTIEGYINAG